MSSKSVGGPCGHKFQLELFSSVEKRLESFLGPLLLGSQVQAGRCLRPGCSPTASSWSVVGTALRGRGRMVGSLEFRVS